MAHVEDLAGPATVLLEDGEIVASLKVYPFTILVNGAPVPMGGVSAVSCLPEARRKGYVGQLLRYSLEKMREAGTPLSALYTPHPSLYRRYGWMTAAANLKYTWHPAGEAYNPGVGAGSPCDGRGLPPMAGCTSGSRPGDWPTNAASEWKEGFFRRYDDDRKPDVAVWYDEAGEPGGYLSYRAPDARGSIMAVSRPTGRTRGKLADTRPGDEIFFGPVEDPLAYAE
jgi:hypothetical protein